MLSLLTSMLFFLKAQLLFVWECVLDLGEMLSNIFGSSNRIKLENGTRIQVTKMIGQGGYSYVYLAFNSQTKKRYALKKVLCQVEEQREMVEKEMRIHLEFRHPNLMPLLDWGWAPGPHGASEYCCMLLPYMEVGSLRNLIDRRIGFGEYLGQGTGGLPEQEIMTLFWGICKGLEALHSHKPAWAHRDLKPDNVMVRGDGCPMLMDFGSVDVGNVVVKGRTAALQLQDAAAQFCTISYRAPELFDVASDSEVDCRTDVWSLGCTLYAMAFGYSPFESEVSPNGQVRIVECTFLRVIGKISFPTYHRYSAELISTITYLLNQDPKLRPHVSDVLARLSKIRPDLQNTAWNFLHSSEEHV